MAGNVINTGSFPHAILPEGIIGYDKGIKEYPSLIPQIFKMESMDRATLRWVKTYGTGVAASLGENEAVSYDHMGTRWHKDIVAQKYGLALSITEDAILEDRAGIIMQKKGTELAQAAQRKRDLLSAAFLDGGFTSGNVSDTGDGKALYATDHPLLNGTFSNRPAVYAAFSEAALEQAQEDIMLNFLNERGFAEGVKAQKIVVGVNNMFEAERVMKSVGQVYTPDNTPNAIKSLGLFPGGVVVHPLLASQNAYHIITDVEDGLKYYTRKSDTMTSDNSFSTDALLFKVVFKCALAALDPRGAYGVYIA